MYGTHNYVFNALAFALQEDVAYLADLLNEQGVMARFELCAHRRRGAWGSTVPIGVFDNDFHENACMLDQHTAARQRTYSAACAASYHNRRPFARRYDVLELDGALYYHPEAMRVYAEHVAHPAFFRALARFLEASEKTPSFIVPARGARPYVPLDQREQVFGHVARGPAWTSDEDAVLRRWFGPRTVGPKAGHHAKLTDEEWTVVLGELPRRNRNSVRNRLVILNEQLKREFFRDGFVSRDRLREYMGRVLGERPRVPIRPTRRQPRPRALAPL